MNAPQIIKTASGEELVVLTKAEYEALLQGFVGDDEDAEDIAIYDARKADLKGGGEVLPTEVGIAILRGDSRLKAIRNWRDVTQMEIATKTSIGQGYLSDLESGRRKGTPETLKLLAEFLDVPVKWIS